MTGKRLVGVIVLGLCMLPAGAAEPADAPAVTANSCTACHADSALLVRNRKLHDYNLDWEQSPHAAAGVSCDMCHGGDPAAMDAECAHDGVLPVSDPHSKLYYKSQPQTCGQCHGDKLEQFLESKHYLALTADAVAPTCTTCHRAMNRRPYYRDILTQTCRSCHNEANREHVPMVTGEAQEVLHRLNVAKAYLSWSTVHFKTLGWPGDSRARMAENERVYQQAVAGVHRFDLALMQDSSLDVLSRLKGVFQDAWDEAHSEQ